MNTHHRIQVEQQLAQMAAEFFARESEVGSLITVTRAETSPSFHEVMIFLSVLPESQEDAALASAKRQRSDFRLYVQKHSKLHPVPVFDFCIDYGEKNRQRIDDLTRK